MKKIFLLLLLPLQTFAAPDLAEKKFTEAAQLLAQEESVQFLAGREGFFTVTGVDFASCRFSYRDRLDLKTVDGYYVSYSTLRSLFFENVEKISVEEKQDPSHTQLVIQVGYGGMPILNTEVMVKDKEGVREVDAYTTHENYLRVTSKEKALQLQKIFLAAKEACQRN